MSEESKRYRYRGFISYSQADKKLAKRLHRALEAYRMPKGVEAALTPKRGLGRFFLDDDELAGATSLGSALEGALDDSENLIVVCSPSAAKSRWVNEEVRHFKARHNSDQVFAIISRGVPGAGDAETECFPPALRLRFDTDGRHTRVKDEPFAPDLQKERFKRTKVRLIAGLLHKSFDELWQRERKRSRARAFQIALVTLLGLTGIAIGVVGVAREISLGNRRILIGEIQNNLTKNPTVSSDQALRLGILAARQSWLSPPLPQAEPTLARAAHQARCISLLEGHLAEIRSLAYIPPGERIVTASLDGTLRLWHVRTGREITQLAGHDGGVISVAVSNDGTKLISGGADNTARIWDVDSETELLSLTGHTGPIFKVEFSSDGTWVLTTSNDNTVRIWNSTSGKLIWLARQDAGISFAALSPDGTRLVTSGVDAKVRVWDVATGEELFSLKGHTSQVGAVQFSADGRLLATASDDSTACIWDAKDGAKLATMEGHSGWLKSVGFSHDGSRIITGGFDYTVRVWETETGTELLRLEGHEGPAVGHFSKDDARIVTTSWDGTARLWDSESGEIIAQLIGHEKPIRAVEFSPNGKQVVTASADGTARVWDATMYPARLHVRERLSPIINANFSPENSKVILAYGAIAVHDLNTGDRIIDFNKSANARDLTPRAIRAVFDAEGQRIVSAHEDGTARVWDVSTGEELISLIGHSQPVWSGRFSPDGTQIVTASEDRTARVWNASTGASA